MGLLLKDYGGRMQSTCCDANPYPARFLHTCRVGAFQRQAVIEEFTKDRVLTAFDAMMGFHLALA